MNKNIEPKEIIQARKVNIDLINKIEHLLAGIKTALNETQEPKKVKGSFICAALFVKNVAEFIESKDLVASIDKEMVDSGLTVYEEKK